jgi:hypothetical protein
MLAQHQVNARQHFMTKSQRFGFKVIDWIHGLLPTAPRYADRSASNTPVALA